MGSDRVRNNRPHVGRIKAWQDRQDIKVSQIGNFFLSARAVPVTPILGNEGAGR